MRSVVLALLAALVFAVAAALQHYVARAVSVARAQSPAAVLPVLGLLPRLLRNPTWLLGFGLNLCGFLVHSLALHFGSLPVVQTLLVTQLLFALPFAAVRSGAWPLARDWAGTALVCAGLALLVFTGSGHGSGLRVGLGWVVLTVAGLVGLAWVARRRAQTRTSLMGLAAGTCFCVTAVHITLVTDGIATGGAGATALSWPVFGLIASGVTAAILVQDAFASGSFPTALTAMTVADPLASWIVGGGGFGSGAIGGGLLLVGGVVLLAYSPTLHDEHAPARLGAVA